LSLMRHLSLAHLAIAHLTSPHLTLALRPSLPLAACLWPACLSHAWLYQLPPMLVASHVPGASRLHASPNLPASSQLACWPGLVCVCEVACVSVLCRLAVPASCCCGVPCACVLACFSVLLVAGAWCLVLGLAVLGCSVSLAHLSASSSLPPPPLCSSSLLRMSQHCTLWLSVPLRLWPAALALACSCAEQYLMPTCHRANCTPQRRRLLATAQLPADACLCVSHHMHA